MSRPREFVEAAAAAGDALGFDPALVFVAHPIQDRTDDELLALADQALERILGALSNTADFRRAGR